MRTHQKSAIGFLAIIALAAASFGSVPDSSAMWGPMTGGLVGRYYDNITGASPHVEIDTSQLKHDRTDANINFSWDNPPAPYADMGANTFGVIWTGYLTIPADGTNWQIGLKTDDGSKVWIDEIPLSFGSPPSVVGADINWKDHAPPAEPLWSTLVSPSPLGPGPHTLRVEYYENGAGATATVWWKSSTQAKEIIPASAFTHCVGDSVCDDSNPCTVDRCGAERENYGFCVHTPATSGTVCRGAAGACDVAEVCNGTDKVCPNDTFVAAGTQCRGAAGACDVAEVCTGASASCPADGIVAAGTVCRGAAGACDVAETCSGASTLCPSDGFVATGNKCRDAAGVCDVAETCTGASASCPSDAVKVDGTVCRGTAGACDVAEVCNGHNVECPDDAVKNAGTLCRGAMAACDATEVCNGASASCPADGMAPAGTVCRAAAGACDVAEACTGISMHCPTDGVAAKTTVCRGVAGACDVAEGCNGASKLCPTDTFVAAGTPCGLPVSRTGCDLQDTCSGSSAICPDLVAPEGQTCGTSTPPGSCHCGQCCGPSSPCLDVQCPNPI